MYVYIIETKNFYYRPTLAATAKHAIIRLYPLVSSVWV